MEPLWDNLKFIKSQFGENEKKNRAIQEMQDNGKIIITPLAFIRGRSLSNILFIVGYFSDCNRNHKGYKKRPRSSFSQRRRMLLRGRGVRYDTLQWYVYETRKGTLLLHSR